MNDDAGTNPFALYSLRDLLYANEQLLQRGVDNQKYADVIRQRLLAVIAARGNAYGNLEHSKLSDLSVRPDPSGANGYLLRSSWTFQVGAGYRETKSFEFPLSTQELDSVPNSGLIPEPAYEETVDSKPVLSTAQRRNGRRS